MNEIPIIIKDTAACGISLVLVVLVVTVLALRRPTQYQTQAGYDVADLPALRRSGWRPAKLCAGSFLLGNILGAIAYYTGAAWAGSFLWLAAAGLTVFGAFGLLLHGLHGWLFAGWTKEIEDRHVAAYREQARRDDGVGQFARDRLEDYRR